MTALANDPRQTRTLGSTDRRDAWWLGPAITFLVFEGLALDIHCTP